MAVKFVIGRAGSGKTHRCFRAIVDAIKAQPIGRPIYWLTPQQATFQAERLLACHGGMGGFCRANVVSFQRLGSDLLAECGGSAVPAVTRLGRQMILGHLLRRHEKQLRFFAKVASQPGLAARLEATISEFERCGKDPQQLGQLADTLAGDVNSQTRQANPLADKLHDLHLIYHEYCQYLGQEWLDPHRYMQQVLDRVSKSRRLAGATIYVDGFADFDEFERRVLARLGRVCGHMEIMLLMDPGSPLLADPNQPPQELSLYYRLEDNYRRLHKAFAKEAVAVEPPTLLRTINRFTNPGLADVEKRLFDSAMTTSTGPIQRIDMVEAPDRRAEAHHAARRIRQLLVDGLRLRDIAVLVRQLDPYQEVLATAFAEHDIPYFIDRRRTMAHHPLLRFTRAVLAIAMGNWPHEAVMTVIKSGLAGLEPHEADQLENYVLEHRLRGPVWGRQENWAWGRSQEDRPMARAAAPVEEYGQDAYPTEEEAYEHDAGATSAESGRLDACQATVADPSGGADGLRCRLRDAIGDFPTQLLGGDGTLTVRAGALAIFQLFDRFGIRRTLGRWIEDCRNRQQHEEASEHEQVWTELVSLFDQMVSLLGNQQVDPPAFAGILDAGLETFDMALAPATLDQVIIGQVDRTRTPQVKAMLLLGINDGLFPCAVQENAILNDFERQELRDHEFEVDVGSERVLLDETLLGYIAFTRASDRLYVSRSVADDGGRPLGPSPFWRRLRQCYPQLPIEQLPQDERGNPALISTPRQLITSLMCWANQQASDGDDRTPRSDPANATFAWLYQWLCSHPCDGQAVDQMRYRAWSALTYGNQAALSADTARALFAAPLSASVSQVESYAACPFQHFVRYGLGLKTRGESDTFTVNLDQAFHRVLDSLVRQMLNRRIQWEQLDPQIAEQLLDTFARKTVESLRGQMMLSSARNHYLLGRIERALEQVIAAQKVAAHRSAFRTIRGQVAFGLQDAALPALSLTTPLGRTANISGQIDRVDMLQQEQQAALAVFDYRLGDDRLSLARVSHGLQLKLLTSLLVMKEHGGVFAGQAKKFTPAAAFYVRLLRQLESVRHPDEAPADDDQRLGSWFKRRGIFDGKYLPTLDTPADGHAQVVSAFRTKDGSLGNKNNTDVTEGDEMQNVLNLVRRKLAQLADQIMDGKIDISPYRMGTFTACPNCWYRSVCRFEPGINRYRFLNAPARTEILLGSTMEGADE